MAGNLTYLSPGELKVRKWLNIGPDAGVIVVPSGTGTISISGGRHRLFTTSTPASARNLHTINGGEDGDVLFLRFEPGSLSIPVRDNDGNLRMAGDFTLDQTFDLLALYKEGSVWVEMFRSNNGS